LFSDIILSLKATKLIITKKHMRLLFENNKFVICNSCIHITSLVVLYPRSDSCDAFHDINNASIIHLGIVCSS